MHGIDNISTSSTQIETGQEDYAQNRGSTETAERLNKAVRIPLGTIRPLDLPTFLPVIARTQSEDICLLGRWRQTSRRSPFSEFETKLHKTPFWRHYVQIALSFVENSLDINNVMHSLTCLDGYRIFSAIYRTGGAGLRKTRTREDPCYWVPEPRFGLPSRA